MAVATVKLKLTHDIEEARIGGISSNDVERYLPPGGKVRHCLRRFRFLNKRQLSRQAFAALGASLDATLNELRLFYDPEGNKHDDPSYSIFDRCQYKSHHRRAHFLG